VRHVEKLAETAKIWAGRRKTIQADVSFDGPHGSATARRKIVRAVFILCGA
jgi:hypothetical protein